MHCFVVDGLSIESTSGNFPCGQCSLVGTLWLGVGQDWVCVPALLRKREQSSLFPDLERNQDKGNERVFDVFAKERLLNTASNHHHPSSPSPKFKVVSSPPAHPQMEDVLCATAGPLIPD